MDWDHATPTSSGRRPDDTSDGLTNSALLAEVRQALQHLYDHSELRKTDLIAMLGLTHRHDPALALRRLLTEAIASLKPEPTVPPQANAWRTYNILSQRYIEQLGQREVATDLGLSTRQLQRQEREALCVLLDTLQQRYGLSNEAPAESQAGQAPADERAGPHAELAREQELEWLRQSVPSEAVDIVDLLQSGIATVRALAQSLSVHLEPSFPQSLPSLAAPAATLRQALLVLLTAAIRCVPGGQVLLRAQTRHWEVCIEIHALRRQAITSDPLPEGPHTLDVARQLVDLSGGALTVAADEHAQEPFVARVILPALEQVPVLVIEDNLDALRLFEHYLAGSRYRFIGVRDPTDLPAALERQAPQAIVLDVMLPGIDGWELLGRLRAHPQTGAVPVIVCTILPQEQLALSLGAAAFMSKPVSRGALLATLDRLLARPEPGYR